MKKLLVAANILMFILLYTANSQDTDTVNTWQVGGVAALNVSQAAFSNWAKGGESSYATTGMFNIFADRNSEHFAWENKLDLGYGVMFTEQNGSRKTDDKIDLNSKIGYKWYENLNVTALMNFKSQFDDGYEYPNDSVVVSKFMSPADLIISLGLDWNPLPWLTLYFSPTTGKFIFVMDQTLADSGAYGVTPAVFDENGVLVTPGENIDPQFGWYATIGIKKDLMENIQLQSKLDLFQNYTDDNADNRMNIDVNWESTIVMKVNSLISANLFVHLIYDHDILTPIYNDAGEVIKNAPRTQFKEVLGIGFSVKF